MAQLSEIISLPVYSINDRKKIGSVENILLCKNNVKYYVVFDEDNDINYLLSPNKIYGQTSQAITIKNLQSVTLMDNEEKNIAHLYNPINSTLISTIGENFGKVKDVILDGSRGIEIVADYTLSFDKILCLGKEVTIAKSKDNEKFSYFAIKKPTFKSDTERPVSIQNPVAPLREIVNNNILIGRKTTQDIVGLNNEIIVRSGSIITPKILNRVKYSGKLKELTLHSR